MKGPHWLRAGYVPGLGRGASGFTTRSDVGPSKVSMPSEGDPGPAVSSHLSAMLHPGALRLWVRVCLHYSPEKVRMCPQALCPWLAADTIVCACSPGPRRLQSRRRRRRLRRRMRTSLTSSWAATTPCWRARLANTIGTTRRRMTCGNPLTPSWTAADGSVPQPPLGRGYRAACGRPSRRSCRSCLIRCKWVLAVMKRAIDHAVCSGLNKLRRGVGPALLQSRPSARRL